MNRIKKDYVSRAIAALDLALGKDDSLSAADMAEMAAVIHRLRAIPVHVRFVQTIICEEIEGIPMNAEPGIVGHEGEIKAMEREQALRFIELGFCVKADDPAMQQT